MWWILRCALLYAAICLPNNHMRAFTWVSLIALAVLAMKTWRNWRSVCKHLWVSAVHSRLWGVRLHKQVSLGIHSGGWAHETASMQSVRKRSGSWDHYRWIPKPLKEMILNNELVSLLSHRTKVIPMDLGSHDQVQFPVLSYRDSSCDYGQTTSLLSVSVSLQKELKFLPEKENEGNFLRQCESLCLKCTSPVPWGHDPTDLAELLSLLLTSERWKGFSCFTPHTSRGHVLLSAPLLQVWPQLVASQNNTELHRVVMVSQDLYAGLAAQLNGMQHVPATFPMILWLDPWVLKKLCLQQFWTCQHLENPSVSSCKLCEESSVLGQVSPTFCLYKRKRLAEVVTCENLGSSCKSCLIFYYDNYYCRENGPVSLHILSHIPVFALFHPHHISFSVIYMADVFHSKFIHDEKTFQVPPNTTFSCQPTFPWNSGGFWCLT